MTSPSPKRRCVLVCQHRSCERVGAADVLAAFKAIAPPGVFVNGSQCLGLCGAGPNVQVAPDNIWYCHVTADDVPVVVQQHLWENRPVEALLHPRMHAYRDISTEGSASNPTPAEFGPD